MNRCEATVSPLAGQGEDATRFARQIGRPVRDPRVSNIRHDSYDPHPARSAPPSPGGRRTPAGFRLCSSRDGMRHRSDDDRTRPAARSVRGGRRTARPGLASSGAVRGVPRRQGAHLPAGTIVAAAIVAACTTDWPALGPRRPHRPSGGPVKQDERNEERHFCSVDPLIRRAARHLLPDEGEGLFGASLLTLRRNPGECLN